MIQSDIKFDVVQYEKNPAVDRTPPSKQEWRKKGPIIIRGNGATAHRSGYSLDSKTKLKSEFMDLLFNVSKLSKGMYLEANNGDENFVSFCDKTIKELIEKGCNDIVEKYMKATPVHDKVPVPTNPVRLKPQPEEFYHIDLGQKDNDLEQKNNPNENTLVNCASKLLIANLLKDCPGEEEVKVQEEEGIKVQKKQAEKKCQNKKSKKPNRKKKIEVK